MFTDCYNYFGCMGRAGALALSLPKCADWVLEVRLVFSPSCTALIKEFC